MERFTTVRTSELEVLTYKVYHDTVKMAKDAALIHARSMGLSGSEHHNPYHMEHLVEVANLQIQRLRELCPTAAAEYISLIADQLVKEADAFLKEDVF